MSLSQFTADLSRHKTVQRKLAPSAKEEGAGVSYAQRFAGPIGHMDLVVHQLVDLLLMGERLIVYSFSICFSGSVEVDV